MSRPYPRPLERPVQWMTSDELRLELLKTQAAWDHTCATSTHSWRLACPHRSRKVPAAIGWRLLSWRAAQPRGDSCASVAPSRSSWFSGPCIAPDGDRDFGHKCTHDGMHSQSVVEPVAGISIGAC